MAQAASLLLVSASPGRLAPSASLFLLLFINTWLLALSAATGEGTMHPPGHHDYKGDARYEVLQRYEGYEARRYSGGAVWAVATLRAKPQHYDTAVTEARRVLDLYFDGGNDRRVVMAATSPVVHVGELFDGQMFGPVVSVAYLIPDQFQDDPPRPAIVRGPGSSSSSEGGGGDVSGVGGVGSGSGSGVAAAPGPEDISLVTVGATSVCVLSQGMPLPTEKAVMLAAHSLRMDLKRDGRPFNADLLLVAKYREHPQGGGDPAGPPDSDSVTPGSDSVTPGSDSVMPGSDSVTPVSDSVTPGSNTMTGRNEVGFLCQEEGGEAGGLHYQHLFKVLHPAARQ